MMPSSRAVDRKTKKDKYDTRKREGVCTACGGEKEDSKLLMCIKCRQRKQKHGNKRAKLRYKIAQVSFGACRNHPTRDAVPGTTMCDYCLERQTESTKRYRAKKKQLLLV